MKEWLRWFIAMWCLRFAKLCVKAGIPGRDFFIKIGDYFAYDWLKY